MNRKWLRQFGVCQHISFINRISNTLVPTFSAYCFSSGSKTIEDSVSNAKRVYAKHSGEKKANISLTNDVSLLRSSASKTKASEAKLNRLTSSLGSMLYTLEVINNSSSENHDPSGGSSIFTQGLKGKISACAAKVETTSAEHDKSSATFYKTAASISKPKA